MLMTNETDFKVLMSPNLFNDDVTDPQCFWTDCRPTLRSKCRDFLWCNDRFYYSRTHDERNRCLSVTKRLNKDNNFLVDYAILTDW